MSNQIASHEKLQALYNAVKVRTIYKNWSHFVCVKIMYCASLTFAQWVSLPESAKEEASQDLLNYYYPKALADGRVEIIEKA